VQGLAMESAGSKEDISDEAKWSVGLAWHCTTFVFAAVSNIGKWSANSLHIYFLSICLVST
jgi:hypothetical protein